MHTKAAVARRDTCVPLPRFFKEAGLSSARVRLTLVAASVLLTTPSLWAQRAPERVDPGVAPPPTAVGAVPGRPPTDRVSASFSLGGMYAFATSLEDDRGDVAVSRAGFESSLFIPAFERTVFSLTLLNEWSWYDFSRGDNPVVAGVNKPFSQVTTVRLTPGVVVELDDRWSVQGGLFADFSGEADVNLGDAGTYGGFVSVRYAFSDRLSVVGGVSVRSVLEDDVRVLPVIGIDWDITDRLNLATRGPGVRLTYFFSRDLDVSLLASYESRDFRLDRDSAISDGVVRDQRVTVGIQAQYAVRPWLILRAEVGVVAWGELGFDDRDGDRLERLTTDPTPYVGASLTLRF